MTTTNNQLDMNANRLKTTERKIEWLKTKSRTLNTSFWMTALTET